MKEPKESKESKESKELRTIVRIWAEAFMMRSMRDMGRYVKTTGLSMPQFSLLMRLYYKGGCEVHDIGRHFDVSSAAASQLVDRLVHAGLVERTEIPSDRRARQIELSQKGRALIDTGVQERYRWVDDVVAALPAKERAALLASLPHLVEAEKALPGREGPGATHGAAQGAAQGTAPRQARHAIRTPPARQRV